jgi:hypothetical protein
VAVVSAEVAAEAAASAKVAAVVAVGAASRSRAGAGHQTVKLQAIQSKALPRH